MVDVVIKLFWLLFTNDRKKTRLQRSKCERDEYITKKSISVDYVLLKQTNLSFAGARSQEKRKIEQICIWNTRTTGFIMLTLIYVISTELHVG